MNAINFPTGRDQMIGVANNGDTFILGNTSDEADAGGWKLTLMPDAATGWTGSITIMRRPSGKGAFDNNVGFMPSSYRRIVVNNTASDYLWDSVALTGASEVQVEGNATSVAFYVQCTAGSARVYTRPVNGPTAP